MKRLIGLFLIFSVLCAAQDKVTTVGLILPEFTTVTLDSSDSQTLYVTFPYTAGPTSARRIQISTTKPTSTSAQAINPVFSSSGNVFVHVIPDTLTRQESDSLYAYIKPLVYDSNKKDWYTSEKDSTFLVFDTIGMYSSTVADYLDWTHGKCYTTTLTNELWPCAGFTITFVQRAFNVATADTKLYLGFWFAY
jgi:hypothetical protein